MHIAELRRILRAKGFNVRKREVREIQQDCAYEITLKGEHMFNINPEKMKDASQVQAKINYELREEYIPPLG